MSFPKKLVLILTALLLAISVSGCYGMSDTVTYTEVLTLSNSYPHQTDSFTQGLFFYDGKLYESAGRYGESRLMKNISLESGGCEWQYTFDDSIFAEGATAFCDKLYTLCWKENKVFVSDPETLAVQNVSEYPRQGWGLTTDGKFLIASDGSANLYFMNENLETVKTVAVSRSGDEIANINELEYIDGYIWANVWLTNEIIIINPENGKVEKTLDFTGLYDNISTDANDCLNGIAYNPENGKVYITGKRWNTLFEFELK